MYRQQSIQTQFAVPPDIYFDLDGLFADFFPVAERILGRPYADVPPAEAWRVLSQVPHLFRHLPLLPGSLAMLDEVAHHGNRVAILTALPQPTGLLVTADADKRGWVAEFASPTLRVITIEGGVNKRQYAHPFAVLVDDSARNLEHWRAAGGIGILHTDVETTLAELRKLGLVPPAQ